MFETAWYLAKTGGYFFKNFTWKMEFYRDMRAESSPLVMSLANADDIMEIMIVDMRINLAGV